MDKRSNSLHWDRIIENTQPEQSQHGNGISKEKAKQKKKETARHANSIHGIFHAPLHVDKLPILWPIL